MDITQYKTELFQRKEKKAANNKYADLTREISEYFSLPKEDFKKVLCGVVLYPAGIGYDKAFRVLAEMKSEKNKEIKIFWYKVNQLKSWKKSH
jgi:hypothetical protein